MAMILLVAASGRAMAQQTMTDADVKRLELNLNDARNDLAALKPRNASLAATLQKDLDALADEVTYLRVKMGREGSVPRSDYVDLRDRIDDLRTRAGANSPEAKAAANAVTIPVGTLLDVRLQTPLGSGTSQVEDRFEATTVLDLTRDGRVVVPAGTVMRGVVAAVDKASRGDRKGSLTLTFDRIVVKGVTHEIKGTVTEATEGSTANEVKKVGGAAAAGAVLGAILGGGKGAAIGAMIGGGGMVAATPGSDVTLPAGTVLTVRLDTALTVR
jgi:hypothetical protein